MPTVTVNGEHHTVAAGTSILALITDLGLQPEATVVQRNDDILDRAVYGGVMLDEGDLIELVRFVGGG